MNIKIVSFSFSAFSRMCDALFKGILTTGRDGARPVSTTTTTPDLLKKFRAAPSICSMLCTITLKNINNFFGVVLKSITFALHFNPCFLPEVEVKTVPKGTKKDLLKKHWAFFHCRLKIWRLEDSVQRKSQMFTCLRELDHGSCTLGYAKYL